MKTVIASLAAVAALATVAVAPAASARPWHHGWHHGHPHKVCFIRHHHRVCRWR